jgi:hypothetical protein
MAPTFPLPRALLPTVDVSPEETAGARRMMDALLRHTVREYARLSVDAHGVVDNQRWKHMGTQDKLLLFRERETGVMSASVAQELEGGARGGESVLMPNRDAVAALAAPSMLMTGSCAGRVENTMYAVVTETHDDLALVVKFLHEDVADCAILATMEGPTQEQPHRFLGYKYFVRKSPTEGRMLKHRDSLYLEYCGYTRCPRTGETLGFHIMHSVDLPEFPSLRARNSVRALQSMRYLYRQRSDDTVDVFMLANLDIAGAIVKPIANMFASTTLFGIARLPACAEARRLTQMTKQRVMREHPHAGRLLSTGKSCAVCQGHGAGGGSNVMKLLGAGLPTKCHICGQLVCARCRRSKRVFERDPEGVLGRFLKVHACSTCVLVANAGYTPPYVSSSESGSQASSSSSSSSSRPNSKRTRTHPSYHSSGSSNSYANSFMDESLRFSHSTVSSLCMSEDADPVAGAASAMERLRMANHPPAASGSGRSRRGTLGAQAKYNDKESMDSDSTWSVSDDTSSSYSSSSMVSRPSIGQQGDLYARLLELQRAAESAYNTTQHNGALLTRQHRQR